MALSLGVSVGERISVGDSIVKIKAIKNSKLMMVTVNGGPDIAVKDDKAHAVEILPGVRLFIGLGKNGNVNRLAFDAPKSVPIRLLGREKGQSEPDGDVHKANQTEKTARADALFINGVFESVLLEILKSQKAHPGQINYLQPYSASRIVLLATSDPTPENPITLYLSVTKLLNLVSYRAKVIGWQDKRELDATTLVNLNLHIQQFQPEEGSIYPEVNNGKPCVNLISVVEVEPIEPPFPVSLLMKVNNGEPLKNRERSGGWVVVREIPPWLGTVPLTVLEHVEEELAAGVAKSLKDSSELRQQRLAHARKMPEAIPVISRAYRRNPDVIAEVLYRANGTCEGCHAPAPFQRVSDNSPYLEVHHQIMLSEGGEDTVANAFALCPNCHRRRHFGKNE